jgi:hypothetical protein
MLLRIFDSFFRSPLHGMLPDGNNALWEYNFTRALKV